MQQTQTQEVYLSHLDGELYVKYWKVADSPSAPIILFHESLGSVEQWKDFPDKLAIQTQRSVIAYDRVGFGKSTGTTGRVKADFIFNEAQFTLPLILQYFNIEGFIVFGHSIGGGFATGCAITFPTCQALIIESILARTDETMRVGIRQAKLAFQNPKWMSRLKLYHGDKAQTVLDAWTESWLSDDFKDWSIISEISKISCPTLIIHPEHDEYSHVNQAQSIVHAMTVQCELQLISECGHVPHNEQPDLIVGLVKKFLNDHL